MFIINTDRMHKSVELAVLMIFVLATQAFGNDTTNSPNAKTNPKSPVMLAGDWVPENPHDIDFANLPRVPSEHVIVSDARPRNGVHQHNYLVHYDGQYWAMWSDGPGVEDKVGQRVSYATSKDGLTWSEPQFLTPVPPDSGPDSKHYNTRRSEGMRYISRGFWVREGKLYALASLDEAAGFFGKSLALHAFRWDKDDQAWRDTGVIVDNAINNFPPKKIPTGDWMMSRRTHDYGKVGVQFLVGGVEAIDQWKSYPVLGSDTGLAAEEPYWWVLPDDNLMALFRDNRRSGFLYRSFSTDNGRTWSAPVKTDFPDATSKFNGLRLSDGRYVLVSNAKPNKRDPLVISISDDGMVFHTMGYLVGGRHIDYPHVIEHNGHLLVAFAGDRKQTVEVLKIRIEDLSKINNKVATRNTVTPPHPVTNPDSPLMLAGDWVPENPGEIDLANLPHLPSKHAVVSDVRDQGGKRVNQHNYLAHYDGLYWSMWSDGPGGQRTAADQHRNVVPSHDLAGQQVSFATSKDGLDWSPVRALVPPPDNPAYGWIARGFWLREGKLLALASKYKAPSYAGPGLSLHAFECVPGPTPAWKHLGVVQDNTLNNFEPKKLPDGQWMMTRRDSRQHMSMMIGGTEAFDQWEILPVAAYDDKQKPEEPEWYTLPDGKNIVGLIRDNANSKRLLRVFSTDNGRTWSKIVRTNFPDARSKFFTLRTSRGYYALVSNANPQKRDPMTLSISRDGLVFHHMFHLVGQRHVDYPHMIEHDGHLLIGFAGAKQTMEVLKISLDDIDKAIASWNVKQAGNVPDHARPDAAPLEARIVDKNTAPEQQP